MTAFRIKEHDVMYAKRYEVQGRTWLGWVTIKTFTASKAYDKELWWASACAENLLEELQKEQ